MAEERINIAEEFKLTPWWAFGLAVAAFAGMEALFLILVARQPQPPPRALQVVLGALTGTLLGFFMLLIGYVNRDAKRRGMNVALWTILVIFIPNAIGFIIYFLVRHPLMIACPQCRTMANPSFNYCPKCKFNLHPSCPQCHRAVRLGDTYCPYCAHELAEG
jgi:RNA polymerase subunit RPABC4/transcription elongation factor Spt4